MPIEVSTVRRSVQQRLEQVRRLSSERRARAVDAERDYAAFLSGVATPLFRTVASVLGAEGYPYKVFTPAGGLRLASDRAGHTYVDLRLDTFGDRPQVVAEVSRERGSRILSDDRPIGGDTPISALTEEDVLAVLLEAIGEMVER